MQAHVSITTAHTQTRTRIRTKAWVVYLPSISRTPARHYSLNKKCTSFEKTQTYNNRNNNKYHYHITDGQIGYWCWLLATSTKRFNYENAFKRAICVKIYMISLVVFFFDFLHFIGSIWALRVHLHMHLSVFICVYAVSSFAFIWLCEIFSNHILSIPYTFLFDFIFFMLFIFILDFYIYFFVVIFLCEVLFEYSISFCLAHSVCLNAFLFAYDIFDKFS